METIEVKPKKPLKSKKSELTHLSEIIQLMRDSGVQKFKYKELIEVEFEPVIKSMSVPVSLDDEQDRRKKIENLSEALKEDVDEELKDLLWST